MDPLLRRQVTNRFGKTVTVYVEETECWCRANLFLFYLESAFFRTRQDWQQDERVRLVGFDIHAVNTFFAVLHGDVDIGADNVMTVLPVASYVIAPDMVGRCEEVMSRIVSDPKENALDRLPDFIDVASVYHLNGLLAKSILKQNSEKWHLPELAAHMELATELPDNHFIRVLREYRFVSSTHRIAMICAWILQRREEHNTTGTAGRVESDDVNVERFCDPRFLASTYNDLRSIQENCVGKHLLKETTWSVLVSKAIELSTRKKEEQEYWCQCMKLEPHTYHLILYKGRRGMLDTSLMSACDGIQVFRDIPHETIYARCTDGTRAIQTVFLPEPIDAFDMSKYVVNPVVVVGSAPHLLYNSGTAMRGLEHPTMVVRIVGHGDEEVWKSEKRARISTT